MHLYIKQKLLTLSYLQFLKNLLLGNKIPTAIGTVFKIYYLDLSYLSLVNLFML